MGKEAPPVGPVLVGGPAAAGAPEAAEVVDPALLLRKMLLLLPPPAEMALGSSVQTKCSCGKGTVQAEAVSPQGSCAQGSASPR